MARESLDIQTNIPFTGKLKYCDARTTKHGARAKLVMVLDDGQEEYPAGECEVWLPIERVDDLMRLDAVDELAPNDKGRQFKVTGAPHLKVVRKEVKGDGGKAHTEYRITRLDEHTPRATAPAPAAATSAGSSPRNGNGHAKLDTSTKDGKREAFTRWLAVGEAYAAACFLADRALTAIVGGNPMTVAEWGDLVQRGAATILVENRGHAPGFPKLLAALEQHYAPPSATREPDLPPPPPESEQTPPEGQTADDDDLPF